MSMSSAIHKSGQSPLKVMHCLQSSLKPMQYCIAIASIFIRTTKRLVNQDPFVFWLWSNQIIFCLYLPNPFYQYRLSQKQIWNSKLLLSVQLMTESFCYPGNFVHDSFLRLLKANSHSGGKCCWTLTRFWSSPTGSHLKIMSTQLSCSFWKHALEIYEKEMLVNHMRGNLFTPNANVFVQRNFHW